MQERQIDYLASVIATCKGKRVVGRTRLQKMIFLLQKLKLPSDYSFSMHFYGPYSEDVQADLAVLDLIDVITEIPKAGDSGQYYVLEIKGSDFHQIDLSNWRKPIKEMENVQSVVLELAATYIAFRDSGYNAKDAELQVQRMKGLKCDGGNLKASYDLLTELGLYS